MRALVINGSPRKIGNTAAMLKEMAKFADEEGSRTDYLHLIDLRIADCKAWLKCHKQGECVQKDDLVMLSTVIKEADLLMLGSPVHMGAETGWMKCFTNRLFGFSVGASPTELESRLTGKRKAIALFNLRDGQRGQALFLLERSIRPHAWQRAELRAGAHSDRSRDEPSLGPQAEPEGRGDTGAGQALYQRVRRKVLLPASALRPNG